MPTPNNGSTELINLYKSKVHEPWFIFQKTKYVWDPNKKEFVSIQFPVNDIVKHYTQWKGYSDEKEIEEAEQKYGKNK